MIDKILNQISVQNSMGVSLKDTKTSDLTSDMLGYFYKDLKKIECNSILLVGILPFRVKSRDSIRKKIEKYKDKDKSLLVTFNDIIGCRIICDKYPRIVESDTIKVFYKNKADGYTAMHVVYQLNEYCYPIEIQYWLRSNVNFNTWSRRYVWKKNIPTSTMSIIRRLYDENKITSEEEFRQWIEKFTL